MNDDEQIVCGRDVCIYIDNRIIMQAESLEIRKKSEIHCVRSCFNSEDMCHIRKNSIYKAAITGIVFKKPFEYCGFADMDNFTLKADIDGKRYILYGCMWDDFYIAADKEKFREHISIIAMRLKTEDIDEGN